MTMRYINLLFTYLFT